MDSWDIWLKMELQHIGTYCKEVQKQEKREDYRLVLLS
jgi:hypothetical protein